MSTPPTNPLPRKQIGTAVVPYRIHNPSLYDPAYCAEIINYFTTAVSTVMQTWEESFEEEHGVKGTVRRVKGAVRAICGDVPTFERFANSIGVTMRTLINWTQRYPDFAYSYERCKEIQKDFLMQGMLSGRMNAQAAIFVATNITDMRNDKTLTIATPPSNERPILANKTPAELQALRELLEKSQSLGFVVELKELPEAEGVKTEWTEEMQPGEKR